MAVATVHAGGIADHIHPEPQGFVRRYVFSLDHKIIGIQYIITAFVFFVLSGLLAEAIRTQLLNPNGGFVAADTYNEIYSVHGSAMVWLVIIPMLTGGFGNLVFPVQIGARDVAFPVAEHAQLLDLPGLRLDAVLVVSDGRADRRLDGVSAGLAARRGRNVDVVRGDLLVGVSSTMTGINFVVTILKMRAPGHDVHAHAALRLGPVRNRAAADDRDDGARRGAGRALHRAPVRRAVLRPDQRRQPGHVAAHVLVLLASGRLHHDLAGVRDHLRGAADLRAQADLRLQADRVLLDGDRAAGLHGLGAPHVHVGARAVLAAALHDPHVRDRRADRHQDLFVDRDALRREDPLHDRDALCDRLHRALHDRRNHRHLPGCDSVRPSRARHVLHRRATSITCSSAEA